MDETAVAPNPGPYAVLRLREGAPRELVEETYWLLVRRLKYGVIDDVEGLRQLDRLNTAYESIARNGVHVQPLPVEGGNGRRWWSRRGQRPHIALDPYETLFVTEEADLDIALLASKVLAGRPPGDIDRQEWDRAVADAAGKLCDPTWRAAQSPPGEDGHGGALVDDAVPAEANDRLSAAQPAGVETAPEAAGGAAVEEPAPVAQPEDASCVDAAEDDASAADPAVATASAVDLASDSAESEPVIAAHIEESTAVVLDDVEMSDSTSFEAAVDAISADAVRTDAHAMDRFASQAADIAPVPEYVRPAAADIEASAAVDRTPDARPAPRSWMERIRGRSDDRDARIEAENERILSLRVDGDAPVVHEHTKGHGHDSADEPFALRPQLRPAASGPVELELTEDEGCDFLLGSEADPARVQIWRQGGRYLLQQVSGPAVSVGGALLASPIIVLEDGDEVAAGDDVVRISFAQESRAGAPGDGIAPNALHPSMSSDER